MRHRSEREAGAAAAAEARHAHDALFPASSVLLASDGAGWRGLRAERLRLADVETPDHHHDAHFLTLPLAPSALVETRPERAAVRLRTGPGEFTLIGSGVPHRVRYENADVLAVSLDADLVRGVAAETGFADSTADADLFAPQRGTPDPQAERFGQILRAEMEAGFPTGPLFADATARALAAHLLRRYAATGGGGGAFADRCPAAGALSPARLRRALDHLEAHLAGDVPLADLAAAAGLSPYHFARAFKAATGLAPHAYLIARRVERARDLVANTDLPLAAVAAATGFAHQSHLTRHFKRLVGASPARFRRR